MESLCLKDYGVSNLETREMKTIDGGKSLNRLVRAVRRYGGMLLQAAGVYDAIDEFSAGFAEGNC